MHEAMLIEVLTDCVAYSEHNAPASILEKWTKEQLAFALSEMASQRKALQRFMLSIDRGTDK